LNIVEKIFQDHSENPVKRVEPGDIVNVKVDKVIMLDIAGLHPELLNNPPKKPFDRDKVAMIFDHFVPAPNVEVASGVSKLRKLAKRWDIGNFFDYGRGGISHTFAAESGWFLPGRIVANTDSHSIAAGAYNMLSRGLGTPELMQVICTGKTWYIVGETIKVNLTGRMNGATEAKDVFLRMAGEMGDIPNTNIEFGGSGIGSLSVDQRAVISTMCAELSADFAVFPYDNVLASYLDGRSEAPYTPVAADKDETYASTIDFDMSEIRPMVAMPDHVAGNTKPAADVQGSRIDQATIGSCANGRLDDLASAARILKGRRVAKDVRLIVTPATQSIFLQADRLGYLRTIAEAGGVVTNPTCGACMGGHMGLLGEGDIAITSTTRNFKGRMGSRDARIYMASSATVAASAVNGYITDPGDMLEANSDE
jgi:3-isopropylmalate/(R)-2-methylmalate dehydratase large subunit